MWGQNFVTSAPVFQQYFLLALPIPLLLGFAFVMALFALGQPQGQLDPVFFIEIEHQGNKGQAPALAGGGKFVDLFFMEQQSSGPARLVI